MKKTVGILVIALLIGMALPALAAPPPEGIGVAEATGAATNNGFIQTADTAAAGEGHDTVAQADSSGFAVNGNTFSVSAANSRPNANGPGKENMTADTFASASGQLADTSAEGIAVNGDTGTTSAGPGHTQAITNNQAGAFSDSFAGKTFFTDTSGNTYFGNASEQFVASFAIPGSSTSSNQATANETST